MKNKLELSPHITVTMVKVLHDIHALLVTYVDSNLSQPACLTVSVSDGDKLQQFSLPTTQTVSSSEHMQHVYLSQ